MLKHESVVPRIASATVTAIVIIKPKPKPPSRLLPSCTAMSPIGALEAAAASSPVRTFPSAPVPVSLSPIM